MKQASIWAVRLSWLLVNGLWGAWVGFRGYFHYPYNPDSFASMFILGFFVVYSFIGLALGVGLGVVAGGATERILTRLGMWTPLALIAATLLNLLLLWQLTLFVVSKYPGFAPAIPKSQEFRRIH